MWPYGGTAPVTARGETARGRQQQAARERRLLLNKKGGHGGIQSNNQEVSSQARRAPRLHTTRKVCRIRLRRGGHPGLSRFRRRACEFSGGHSVCARGRARARQRGESVRREETNRHAAAQTAIALAIAASPMLLRARARPRLGGCRLVSRRVSRLRPRGRAAEHVGRVTAAAWLFRLSRAGFVGGLGHRLVAFQRGAGGCLRADALALSGRHGLALLW